MGWEQDITQLLQEAQDIAVRFDVKQELTDTEKARARNNIGIGATATNIGGNDYELTLNN